MAEKPNKQIRISFNISQQLFNFEEALVKCRDTVCKDTQQILLLNFFSIFRTIVAFSQVFFDIRQPCRVGIPPLAISVGGKLVKRRDQFQQKIFARVLKCLPRTFKSLEHGCANKPNDLALAIFFLFVRRAFGRLAGISEGIVDGEFESGSSRSKANLSSLSSLP